MYIFPDRHHFDNPVYSGAPRPGTSISGGLPLNNGCSRVVNHFAPSVSVKKHVNIERDKLGVAGGANHYQEDTEEEDRESGIHNIIIIIILIYNELPTTCN